MKHVLAARTAIYNQFHGSSALSALSPHADDFAAYYTAMYLIQDTAEAVETHTARGFSTDPLLAYLEFWGVMQATFIQQDAIFELCRVVTGSKPAIGSPSAWYALRDIRNVCAGHPANRGRGTVTPQRTFMGRSFGNYDRITYELWEEGAVQPRHPTFNLRQMIGDYDLEAGPILQNVLNAMKLRWP